MGRSDRQPVDRAAPAVPSRDDGAHNAAVGLGDNQCTRVMTQEAGQRLGRIGGCRFRCVHPEGQHAFDVICRRRPEVTICTGAC